MTDANRTMRKELTQAQVKVTGKVFCTSCQQMAAEDAGRYRSTADGKRRFVCGACVERLRQRRLAA